MALAAPLRVIVVPGMLLAGPTVPEMVAVAEIVIVPLVPPTEAEITDWPMPAANATALALRLTAAGLEELQIAELVRFCVLPSLKFPVAVSCSFEPVTSDVAPAVMAIDCSVAAFTDKVKLFEVIPF